jgi:hypothetical protein
MILKSLPSIPSSSFEYDKGFFSAEASELGSSFNIGKIFDDACDVGFSIVSAKTGSKAIFALSGVDTNEGDVLCWNFKCVTKNLEYLEAVIFND